MISQDILVDRNKLEEECSSAPAFFDYWQNQESNLKVEKESFENKKDLEIRAMTDAKREEIYGTPKSTEGAISSMIKGDPEYIRLNRLWLQAMSERKSWEKKLDMLDTLAKLHGQGYFAKIEGTKSKDTITLLANSVKKKIIEEIERRKKVEAESSKKPKRPQ